MVALSLKQANLLGRLAAMFAPRLHCVSFEHTARYRYRSRRAAGVYGPVLKALSWRVDEIWADCESTLQETQAYFLPRRRRSHIVPLFCSDEASSYKRDYALHTPLRLAAAGRLIPLKNFDRLIEAIRMLQDAAFLQAWIFTATGLNGRRLRARRTSSASEIACISMAMSRAGSS
ncbi:hypothetical protein AJ88_12830 [Mesorhizobium amorphae CCBAU 01583]|nr:hypothetical protein AJ88_12830 [Mesorhizobium amorphae CCBAU 01583]